MPGAKMSFDDLADVDNMAVLGRPGIERIWGSRLGFRRMGNE